MVAEKAVKRRKLAAIFAWLVVAACGIGFYLEQRSDPLIEDVKNIQHATAPDRAEIVGSPARHVPEWRYTTAWTVETLLTWSEYLKRVDSEMPNGFHPVHETRRITYTRQLAADTQLVTLERLTDGPPLKVNVAFVSAAN
jgi:hypothetical protein